MSEQKKSVKEIRKETRMTQPEFAGYFGIPVRTLQEWEQGRQNPPVYVVEMMERILRNEYFK